MTLWRKTICILTALCLVSGLLVLSANASEDPLAVKDFVQFGAAEELTEETEPEEIEPEETEPEETEPEETEPEET